MELTALRGFAPFAAFALIEKLIGIVPGLATGFGVSLALLMWELMGHRRAMNMLEAGSALLFGALTILALLDDQNWSVWQVRFYVDAGLATVVFFGVLLSRPFTLQTARQRVAPELARRKEFIAANMILSGVWGGTFVILATIDKIMVTYPSLPDRRGIILTLLALAAAARFTQWFVKRNRD